MRVIHIITGLNNGGAEGVLYRLCKHDTTNSHIVVSLMDEGKYGPMLQSAGVEIFCLNLLSGKISISALWRLFKFIRLYKPDVVQTWMYHADLIGGLVARLAGVKNVYWNIRHTELVPGQSKKTTILVAKACALLSRFVPKGIVCCAQKAIHVHAGLGYVISKMKFIGNGYDLSLYNPNDEIGLAFRKELNIPYDYILLGMVGRFDIQKDHFGLLQALAIVRKSVPQFYLALIGRDLNCDNQVLINEIKKHNLELNVILLDQRSDIPNVMNSFDIHILSSSFGEGFPNVIAEAMACGIPCVTTDVGDANLIVGKTGWVVPPKVPQILADVIIEAIEQKQNHPISWEKRKQSCRNRIFMNFSIEKMIKNYHKIWTVSDLS